MQKTYCELFLRWTEILGPVYANSGIAESGIRLIDCIRIRASSASGVSLSFRRSRIILDYQ